MKKKLTIPPEICDMIINFLEDDKRTLRNCSLVCKSWLPASRTHLFTFPIRLSASNIRPMLSLLLARHSTILPYVYFLLIKGDYYYNQGPAWPSPSESLPTLQDPPSPIVQALDLSLPELPPFPNLSGLFLFCINWPGLLPASKNYIRNLFCGLSILHLNHIIFESFDDFAQVVSSATSLNELQISFISYLRDEPSLGHLQALPPIDFFCIGMGLGTPAASIMRWLAHSNSPSRIHTMDVNLITMEDVPILSALLPFFERLGQLELSFMPDENSSVDEIAAVFSREVDLSLNKALDTIIFCDLDANSSDPQDFKWISDIISRATVSSLERVGLTVFLDTPVQLQPIITGLSAVLGGENTMFMKQSTKLRFNIHESVELKVKARAWIEKKLYQLDKRGQLEFI